MPTAQEIQEAQAREAAGRAAAEAANLAWRTNTAPRLPYYGNAVGYTQEEIADAAREAAKHDAAFHTTYDYQAMAGLTLSQIASRYGTAAADNVQEYYRANPSARAQAIDAEYAAQQNRVIGGDGVMYQGEVRNTQNPYDPNSALGIAWEVGRTGGATDFQMNIIAEREAQEMGVDASFIRYATDVYMERPGFEREVLTTKTGQQFTNEAWHGVPIRLNLTREEMAAGGGINKDNFGKFLRYDDTTHLLTRMTSPEGTFGIDEGVHKERGDFGGPILEGGTYGGWSPDGGRSRGSKVNAGDFAREGIGGGVEIKKPFTSANLPQTQQQKPDEYVASGFLGLGGLFPEMPSKEKQQAYGVDLRNQFQQDPVKTFLKFNADTLEAPMSLLGGVASRMTFGLSEFAYKPKPITEGGSQYSTKEEVFDLPTTRTTEFVNLPTSSVISGGNQTITDLGNWLTGNRDSIDRYDKKAVADYNAKSDLFNRMSAQNPTLLTESGGTKEIITETGGKRIVTTTTENSAFKFYASEWDKFVEGSGRVLRHITGLTKEKQDAYFETIKNTPGVLGEARRGVFYFGTEVVNKPAELAPAALTGFGIKQAVGMAPGFLTRVGAGTGATSAAARFLQTPGGQSLANAGAVGLFGGAYVYGVTDKLTASPEKTKENIYRSGPALAAMYGGGGGFDDLPRVGIRGLEIIDRRLPDIRQSPVRGGSGDVLVRAGPQLSLKEISNIPITDAMKSKVSSAKAKVADFESKGVGFENIEYKQAVRESNPYYHQRAEWSKRLDDAIIELNPTLTKTKPKTIESLRASIDDTFQIGWEIERTNARLEQQSKSRQIQAELGDVHPINFISVYDSIPKMETSLISTMSSPKSRGFSRSVDLSVRNRMSSVYTAEMNLMLDDVSILRAGSFLERVSPAIERQVEIPEYRTSETRRADLQDRYWNVYDRLKTRSERTYEKLGLTRHVTEFGTIRYGSPELSKTRELQKYGQLYPELEITRERELTKTRQRELTIPWMKTLERVKEITTQREITKEFEKQFEITKTFEITKPFTKEIERTKTIETEVPWERITERVIPRERTRIYPDEIPPITPFGGFGGAPGGGGSGYHGNLGVRRWVHDNLIADKPYLQKGLKEVDWGFADDRAGFDFEAMGGKRRKKKSKSWNPFA